MSLLEPPPLSETKSNAIKYTLIAVAISTAYIYSTLVVWGLSCQGFFWELATLVDIIHAMDEKIDAIKNRGTGPDESE